MAVPWIVPVEAMPSRDVEVDRAMEQLEHSIRPPPTAIPPVVDDQRLLHPLTVELPDQVDHSLVARVRDVDIAHLAAAPLLHVGPVPLDPGAVAQRALALGTIAGQQLDRHLAGRGIDGGPGADGQGSRQVGQPLECRPWVFEGVEGRTIHCEEILADLHVDSGLPERIAGIGIPGSALVDLRDPVGAVVLLEVDPEHSHRDFGWPWHIPRIVDPAVGCAQLADHLAGRVVHVLPAGAMVKQLSVFLAHRGPVHVVHPGIVEEIAEEAPCIRKDLSPFGGRVDLHRHAGQVDGMVQGLTGCAVHDRQRVASADQELLAVGGEIEIRPAGRHHGRIVMGIAEIEEADGSLAVGLSRREEQLPLIGDRQVPEALLGGC